MADCVWLLRQRITAHGVVASQPAAGPTLSGCREAVPGLSTRVVMGWWQHERELQVLTRKLVLKVKK